MKVFTVLLLLVAICFCSCKSKIATASAQMQQNKELTRADKILASAFQAHGGEKYKTAHYAFVFRDKKYTFQNKNAKYTYTVSYEKDGKKNVNQLDNDGLIRTIDGEKVTGLSEKAYNGYVGAINSVIYFVTLPYKLYDPAVNKSYQGETTIKGKKYEILKITFNEEGGGPDHDDEYYYWINQKTNRIDYLAYNYLVNNGGVRFRSAYNPRVVDGILFQDYVNYKAEVGTPLADLPALFEQKALKQLSLIETEEVVHLK